MGTLAVLLFPTDLLYFCQQQVAKSRPIPSGGFTWEVHLIDGCGSYYYGLFRVKGWSGVVPEP